MYIVTQDKTQAVMVSQIRNICKCQCCNSLFVLTDITKTRIGEYATAEERDEVFFKVLAAVRNNVEYQMPQSKDPNFVPKGTICDDDEDDY